jgi:hypothetical protein
MGEKLVFQSIPVNTLLFGCETWMLTDSNKKKISSVYHEGLRKVLGLRMNTVEKHRIRNKHVRNKLGVPHILDIIMKRQHDFLGKIAGLHIKKKTTNLLIIVLSLYPTWVVDPDTALGRGQWALCQSGCRSCF